MIESHINNITDRSIERKMNMAKRLTENRAVSNCIEYPIAHNLFTDRSVNRKMNMAKRLADIQKNVFEL